jgi:superfamily I DNA/RNA helicase
VKCDNVLILPDLSNAAVKSYDYDPDETHRLFYVGVTRAKKSLHIVEPRNTDKAYIL